MAFVSSLGSAWEWFGVPFIINFDSRLFIGPTVSLSFIKERLIIMNNALKDKRKGWLHVTVSYARVVSCSSGASLERQIIDDILSTDGQTVLKAAAGVATLVQAWPTLV